MRCIEFARFFSLEFRILESEFQFLNFSTAELKKNSDRNLWNQKRNRNSTSNGRPRNRNKKSEFPTKAAILDCLPPKLRRGYAHDFRLADEAFCAGQLEMTTNMREMHWQKFVHLCQTLGRGSVLTASPICHTSPMPHGVCSPSRNRILWTRTTGSE
jgi:hypothetical protein